MKKMKMLSRIRTLNLAWNRLASKEEGEEEKEEEEEGEEEEEEVEETIEVEAGRETTGGKRM